MSITQKYVLAGLALLTALVCFFALIAVRAAFGPSPSMPTPEPAPTATHAPTPTPLPTPTRTPRPDVGDKYGAAAMCKHFIKDRLIAPRDAKWPGLFEKEDVAQTGPATWRVRSWVDAANRLGVHVRINYTCEVRYLGGDRWQLEALDMQEP
jgi:hypothetical protein